jgi:signal transduction histidine kinase
MLERNRGEEAVRQVEAVKARFYATVHQVLGMIASGSALPDVLERMVLLVEQQSHGMRCSVLLLDDDGTTIRHAAAPGLPPEYVRMIDGLPIGPRVGSCGTAMFLAQPVIVTDMLADPLWEDLRDAARSSGQRACWAMPIFSLQGRVLGSIALYYSEPRAPRDDELGLIEWAADVAAIAIEQQRAHEALRQSETRNRAILRAVPDMMFLLTADGTYLDFHVQDDSRLFAPPSAFLGRNVRDVLPPPLGERLAQAVARVARSDESETVQYSLELDDAERFFEAFIVGCDGNKVLSIVRDVTDRKRAEVEAAAHRRELAHLSRVGMLGELTGALAHELSQPLTAVLGNAETARLLVSRDPLDLHQLRAALDDIIKNNKHAAAVIDHVRALLRNDETVLQPVNVNDVVREVVELAHGEAVSRHITITTTLAPRVPPVLGDRVQLQQVVLNLVLNACDAMSEAPVAHRQLTLATEWDNGHVRVVVSDRGVGIPADQLERVFEPFVTFRKKGLGLGLAISRSIVTAHRGSIRADNNADGGATFRFSLPRAAVSVEQTVSAP